MVSMEYTADEITRKGQAIYEQQIEPRLKPKNKGQFLFVDIETGQYEIDDDDLAAAERALSRNPDAILYGMRIGYPAAHRIGKVLNVEQL